MKKKMEVQEVVDEEQGKESGYLSSTRWSGVIPGAAKLLVATCLFSPTISRLLEEVARSPARSDLECRRRTGTGYWRSDPASDGEKMTAAGPDGGSSMSWGATVFDLADRRGAVEIDGCGADLVTDGGRRSRGCH
ncbi:hypothetical protein M6B38_129660 [Iris pallida]|uniref:Uncharacterized protein n=1 Tax=Iris pallida TaxID=29817 RepID=A0AAX6G6U6_IRIPA|nr:hypothetical protein M6B38_129660 [Iris pallida]